MGIYNDTVEVQLPLDEIRKLRVGDSVELRIKATVVELVHEPKDTEDSGKQVVCPCMADAADEPTTYGEFKVQEVSVVGSNKFADLAED